MSIDSTRKLLVGISEMKVSNRRDEVLITYSLGSCVGLTIYDPEAAVGGMIHCMLPVSKIDPIKAKAKPAMFTDTGIPMLLQAVFDLGAVRKRIVARVAGGASPLDDNSLFRIGERNYTVLRKVLWKNDIMIAGEDIGGTEARTMLLYMDSGETRIKSGGREKVL